MNLLKKILSQVSILIPKNTRSVVILTPWCSEGNGYLFYEFTKKYNPRKLEFSLIDTDALSVKTLRTILRAKTLISSHGPLSIKSRNQKLISLFHGIPIKNIGLLWKDTPSSQDRNWYKTIDTHCVTSPLCKIIFWYCWGLSEKNMSLSWEPILDYLDTIKSKKQDNYLQTILYAPTHRDDPSISEKNISDFIRSVENDTKNLYIISLHPKEKQSIGVIFSHLPKHIELASKNSIEYLPHVDILITDISSIYYYALYLRKKVFTYFPDREEYLEEVGSIFPYWEIFPGIIDITTSEITTLLNSETYPHESLDILRKLFFSWVNGSSNKNIYTLIP